MANLVEHHGLRILMVISEHRTRRPLLKSFQDFPARKMLFKFKVLARIKFKHPKKHVATTMTCHLWEIFLVKCQKQAFSSIKGKQKCIAMHFCMF
jgi:hypothetical protein